MKILLPKDEIEITMTKTFFMTEIIEFKDKIAQIALYYEELHALIGESHPSVNVANNIWRSIAK